MANKNLSAAKKAKNDEFYTLLEDIENELKHYKKHFENKIVYCNCDDPYESNFFKFFVNKFNDYKLKKLIATSYSGSPIANIHLKLDENGQRPKTAWKIEIDKIPTEKDGSFDLTKTQFKKFIKEHSTKLKGDGSFQSEECIEILKTVDIVCTNPPFSLFREFVKQLMDYNKNFLIIGPMGATSYKEMFTYIKENKVWLGNNAVKKFICIDSNKSNVIEENGIKYAKFGNICWYTNLSHSKRNEKLFLIKKYLGHESEYPKYDNYDAINIDKIKDIPSDYNDVIGVPITFLEKYCPKQFKIIGVFADKRDEGSQFIKGTPFNLDSKHKKFQGPVIAGKAKYSRIIIQKLTKEEIEAIEKAEKENKEKK